MLNKTSAFTARLKSFNRKKVAITSTGKLMQAIKKIKMRPIIAITNNPLLFIVDILEKCIQSVEITPMRSFKENQEILEAVDSITGELVTQQSLKLCVHFFSWCFWGRFNLNGGWQNVGRKRDHTRHPKKVKQTKQEACQNEWLLLTMLWQEAYF